MTYDALAKPMIAKALADCTPASRATYHLTDFEGITPEMWIAMGCASEWTFEGVMARREAAAKQARADHKAELAYRRSRPQAEAA